MIRQVVKEVSGELGIPEEVCLRAYTDMWKFIRRKIADLPLNHRLTDEEFKGIRPNFNIPSFGKLYVTARRYSSLRKQTELIERIKHKKDGYDIQDKETETAVQPDCGD